MKKKKEMTEQERQIVRELGHPLYTVEYLETWINRNDNVMCNAVEMCIRDRLMAPWSSG